MAVSYLSNTYKSSPYILPLDLGLFSNVLSIKQKKFDEGASKIQAEIDSFGTLDVIKSEDRDYLNSKINNLVSSINNYGGIDFSDPSTLNQIQGLGSDIYADNKILTAVASTKSVRNLMGSYEKMKTDPKLTKMYSEVNETYDMQGVNSYLNDKNVGTKYSGPTSATPYTAYRDNHIKMFEKRKADLQTTLTDNGLYYSKVTGQYLTPAQIMSEAALLLTPQERAQMKRDGWYLYRGATPDQIIEKGSQQFSTKLENAKRVLQQYETMAAASVSDPQARKNYNILADEQAKVVKQLSEAEQGFKGSVAQKLKENPEEVYYQLYSNDYFEGLGSRFSVNRTDREIIPNTAEMFRQKMVQADNQFRANYGLKEREMDIEEEKLGIEYLKVGKYRHVNPQTGQVELLDLPGWKDGQQHLITETPNIENPDDLKVTERTFVDMNNGLKMENDKIAQDYISRIVALQPELGETLISQAGKGYVRKLKGQSEIEGFNSMPGFQMEDLKLFETTTDEKGNPVYKNETLVQRFGKQNGLNSKQLEFFANQWKNYEAMAMGKGSITPDLTDGFPEAVEKITMNNLKLQANEKKLEDVKNTIYDQIGLSDNQRKIINDRLKDRVTPFTPEAFIKAIGDIFSFDSFEKTKLKALARSMPKLINQALSPLSTRDVYGIRTLGEKEPLVGELADIVRQEIVDNKSDPYANNPKIDITAVGDKGIRPRMIGKTSDGTGRWMVVSNVTVGKGDKQATIQYKSYISDENAKAFGLENDPYEAINYSVNVNGRASDIPVYGNKNMTAFIDVVGYNTDNINDRSSFAQVKVYYLDQNGQKTNKYDLIKIPATEGRTPSEAFVLAKEAIKQAAQLGLKYEDFTEYLRNYKNR